MSDEGAVAWLRQVIEGDKGEAQLAVSAENIIAAWVEPTSGVLQTGMGTEADCWDGTWALGDSRLARFIARHDPQDVIADCEAKLATLDEHTPDYLSMYGSPGPPQCKTCITDRSGYEEHWEGDPWPCLTLRLLARTYRHREGYADHWGVLATKEGA